jgi:hypothetical protein
MTPCLLPQPGGFENLLLAPIRLPPKDQFSRRDPFGSPASNLD